MNTVFNLFEECGSVSLMLPAEIKHKNTEWHGGTTRLVIFFHVLGGSRPFGL